MTRKAGRGSKPSTETATERLTRLLTMVPWLLSRQGVDIEQAAAEFQVSREQLESDLALLFLCGTPGGMPDDLIEAEWEEGRVYLGNAEAISRPLRLGRDEALALIVALRTLADIPGLPERDALDRTLVKLEEATLSGAASSVDAALGRIRVDLAEGVELDALTRLREAMERGRRVHLRYLVAGRDESTERDVDPMRLINVDGRWYLEGWCRRSEDVRLFRLDRIEELLVLEVPGRPPEQAHSRDLDSGVFQPGPNDLLVELALSPSASWVADYYPYVHHELRPDGSSLLTLRTADVAWIRRLLWRLGGQGRVVDPAWLAAEIAEGAQEALKAYGRREDVD